MDPIQLLAQAAPNINAPLATLGQWAIGIVVLLGGSTVMLGLIFRGIQQKYGDAYIKKQIEAWYASEPVKESREKFTHKVIDDSIHRDDGLIHKAIDAAVATSQNGMEKKLDTLIERADQSNVLYQSVLQKLSHLEGSVEVIKSALKLSHPNLQMPKSFKISGGGGDQG